MIKTIPRISTDRGSDISIADQYVFTTNGRTPASGISKAKTRVGEFAAKIGPDGSAQDGTKNLVAWRLHDLRRTFASGLANLGINLPVVEKLLNHTSGSFGGVQGVYQRHAFAAEKRDAVVAWSRYIEFITKASDNQIHLDQPARLRAVNGPLRREFRKMVLGSDREWSRYLSTELNQAPPDNVIEIRGATNG